MKNTTTYRLLLVCFTLGNVNILSANEGWYAGIAMGSNSIDLDTPTIDGLQGLAPLLPSNIERVSFNGFDDDRVGFILNGGYRLNSNVALNFDFSASYADLRVGYSNTTNNPGTDHFSELDVTSYYLTPGVHLIYPINNKFEVYAKLGLSFILTDIDQSERSSEQISNPTVRESSNTLKDWDIAPTVGFGGQWNFGENWAATFEYTVTQFKLQPISSPDADADTLYDGVDYDNQNILAGLRYNFK